MLREIRDHPAAGGDGVGGMQRRKQGWSGEEGAKRKAGGGGAGVRKPWGGNGEAKQEIEKKSGIVVQKYQLFTCLPLRGSFQNG